MTQKQHVDIHRKLGLRKRFLPHAPPGPVYVPFIGDGDIAHVLYRDRGIWGADNDPERIAKAGGILNGRNPTTVLTVADCNGWPFTEREHGRPVFAVADFDAYSEPYASFRAFWANAYLCPTVVMFFTDAQRGNIFLNGGNTHPDGSKRTTDTDVRNSKRLLYSHYFRKTVLPWFEDYIQPATVKMPRFYHCNYNMLYWAVIVENVGNGEK